jgi:RNA polymerase sigma-70 factor (ECF subfamily)
MPRTPVSTPPTPDPAELYDRYGREVYGWAYRLLGRHHDALDVAQDVFVRFVRHATPTMPDNPQAWLRRVTINRSIDVVRARHDGGARGFYWAPGGRPDSTGPELDELRAAIAAALADLTNQQRSVLVAKVYDGLSFARIAAQLDLAVPTVKTHYLRALRAVRDRLAPRWQDATPSRGPGP